MFYGKWFVMEVPMSWRPKMKSLIKGVTSVPGAFFIGFVEANNLLSLVFYNSEIILYSGWVNRTYLTTLSGIYFKKSDICIWERYFIDEHKKYKQMYQDLICAYYQDAVCL